MSTPNHMGQIRSTILFLVGIGGFIYELIVSGKDRPAILVVCLMFSGLPVVFNVDKILQGTSLYNPTPSQKKDETDDGTVNKEGS